jgi:cytochrome c oxidase cbb3-type subunit 4
MDINFLRSALTVIALAAFLGVVWWAYGPSRRRRFERDALLPFDPSPPTPLPKGEGSSMFPSPPGRRDRDEGTEGEERR